MARTAGASARLAVVSAALVAVAGGASTLGGSFSPTRVAAADDASDLPSDLPGVPQLACGPGSRPESDRQGRVPASDYASGRAATGYTCNATLVSRLGKTGGFQVHRYVDRAGRECAYFDTFLFPPRNAEFANTQGTGTHVIDMSDPRRPVETATLVTPAMLSPHESTRLNSRRGLLVAVQGPEKPGFVDVYDLTVDCRHPKLLSSTPFGIVGHESALSPDGRTFYVSSINGATLAAVDLGDPSKPTLLWLSRDHAFHGMTVSADGTRLYATSSFRPNWPLHRTVSPHDGMRILDVGDIHRRKPNPQVRVVGNVTWRGVAIPQSLAAVRVRGRPYVVEMDELTKSVYSYRFDHAPGVGRVIDVSNERQPRVVSELRLEVHATEARAGAQSDDPGARVPLLGYNGHYCSVPRPDDPGIVACTMVLSGLRVFDIRDPARPKEVAYANFPGVQQVDGVTYRGAAAASSVAFVPERGEVWYSDVNSGFHVLRLSERAWPRSLRVGA